METKEYDAIVYGATPGGIAASLAMSRQGLRVGLCTHNHYLGGMFTNGLGSWDSLYTGNRSAITQEFLVKMKSYYKTQYGPDSEQYRTFNETLSPEPHVAEKVINEMVASESIDVYKNCIPRSAERRENIILAVNFYLRSEDVIVNFWARAFVDASYEGDLAAICGARYKVGRESRDEYNEPHAGKIFTQFISGKFPKEAAYGKLNLRWFNMTTREIFAGSTGEGDEAVMAYNFRSILSKDPDNRVYPPKPVNYKRETYLPLLLPEEETVGQEFPFRSTWIMNPIEEFEFRNWKPLPNQKLTWNHGNLVGGGHGYPTGDWEKRKRISQEHKDFELGLLYFLQNDPDVPDIVRSRACEWGLARDEFLDNDHWPYELYVREARRIVGRYVFTENDGSIAPGTERASVHDDAIAITEWAMDSHECTRERRIGSGCDGLVLLNEKTRPGQVPYRILLPEDIDNLLVTGCVSASHVGFGTIRMEATWMHIGEAAGFAIALAERNGIHAADVHVSQLQDLLLKNGLMLTFYNDLDMSTAADWLVPIQYFGTKGFFSTYNAEPEVPLLRKLAFVWVKAALTGGEGDRNVQKTVREVHNTEQSGGEMIDRQGFLELVQKELNYRCGGCKVPDWIARIPSSPVLRGEASRVLYHLVKDLVIRG